MRRGAETEAGILRGTPAENANFNINFEDGVHFSAAFFQKMVVFGCPLWYNSLA